jgi:hypothetical protein
MALVEAETDLSVHAALRELQTVLDELTLGTEVVAVVELDGPVVGDELITEGTDLAVQDETCAKLGLIDEMVRTTYPQGQGEHHGGWSWRGSRSSHGS